METKVLHYIRRCFNMLGIMKKAVATLIATTLAAGNGAAVDANDEANEKIMRKNSKTCAYYVDKLEKEEEKDGKKAVWTEQICEVYAGNDIYAYTYSIKEVDLKTGTYGVIWITYMYENTHYIGKEISDGVIV